MATAIVSIARMPATRFFSQHRDVRNDLKLSRQTLYCTNTQISQQRKLSTQRSEAECSTIVGKHCLTGSKSYDKPDSSWARLVYVIVSPRSLDPLSPPASGHSGIEDVKEMGWGHGASFVMDLPRSANNASGTYTSHHAMGVPMCQKCFFVDTSEGCGDCSVHT